ncbi:hypothetical protein [Polaribacter aquimarinus]|uniref:Lipoprotein n=1 Tax=Polaribacter aquimarinus TaxID=2100726 RepID=A0A2U2JDQ7_9FLAO|nr:hypothetical protein [Polaribacter aquimarinus]PWG06442.1 hypothetical protein DIS07_01020 [Polaribacter aquimarinus]
MKTTISREQILKSSILFFSFTAFILSALLFTSCSESEVSESLIDDTALITKIETASKVTVEESSLPAATKTSFNGELSDTFIKTVEFATGLGYKVSVGTDNESRAESSADVFFSAEGRQLADKSERAKKRRQKCFQFVFPIDFIMPDDSSITLNSKEDWTLIREWYKANADVKERPELVFPVNVTLEDGTEQTLIDREELKAVKDSCKKGKDKRKCYKLVLPVTFTMPDASVITVNEKSDFKLLRRWHKANPRVKRKGVLNFPVDITYKDGTTATINNADEMKAAKQSCRD